ncbi:Golgi membrane protein [Microdochium trichocladiopsis]|uniref:Protein CASP n=1 Tax=Microdochium trichocladiopsis TaxID=1682393 RepID=A0A9P9BRF7_9PEZI|nr:Golgi membrane protein [Microdochium trichocladiopsis]KAH7032861.1 Golgi membrane protein [Microdochium trichocladiopsis]
MADLAEFMPAVEASKPDAGTTKDTPSGPSAETTNKFQDAIAAWRAIDLTNLIQTLDNTASDIVSYQRDSTVQRKDLAQKTKDFRKLDDAAKLTEIKGLLKAYQTFIDLLTNHSKSTNSAFLQVYSAFENAPDPYPLLEASVDSMLVSEDTLPKLTQENEHQQKSISKLTTQLEDTETRLQTETTNRKDLERNLETKVKEVEQTWTALLEESKENWETKEIALEEKIESQDRLLTEIKASYEVNQRLKGSEDAEADGARGHVTSAELDMVNSDLERTSARLAEVEARNEQLRLDLAQAKSQLPTQAPSPEDDPSFMRMRSENSSLIRKLDASRLEKEAFKRDIDTKLRGLEREVGLLKDERDSLKTKVQKWSDYEDVKQELEVLKSIEFATGDDDDVLASEESNGATTKAKGDTLEQLLLARNKKLSDELTILRVSHQDLQGRLENLQEDMSRTNADLERAQNLNAQLENDLANLQAEGQNHFSSGASVAGTYAKYAPSLAPGRRGGRTSPTSSIISGFNPRDGGGGEAMGGGSGILPMITAQRDRFKQRNAQLETELSETHRSISQLRQEVAALQKDNLQLYEKTRYVSSYNRGASATSSSAYSSNPNPSTVAIGGSGNPGIALDRYKQAYEANISPFAAFRGRESARAYKRMSLPERVVYSITRMVLASRTSRNLFAAYCLALHVLVFLSLYWMGTVDVEQHGSHLGQAAAAAAGAGAAGVRGGGAGSGGGGGGGGGNGAAAGHGAWQQDAFNGQ